MIRGKNRTRKTTIRAKQVPETLAGKDRQTDKEIHERMTDVLVIWMIGSSYFKIQKDVYSTDAAVPPTWTATPTASVFQYRCAQRQDKMFC